VLVNGCQLEVQRGTGQQAYVEFMFAARLDIYKSDSNVHRAIENQEPMMFRIDLATRGASIAISRNAPVGGFLKPTKVNPDIPVSSPNLCGLP
jgi:hypothetical protein